jgi:hypothetical protein
MTGNGQTAAIEPNRAIVDNGSLFAFQCETLNRELFLKSSEKENYSHHFGTQAVTSRLHLEPTIDELLSLFNCVPD